jgi:thymidylate synthase
VPNYLPYDQRTPDSQYQDMLARILHHGEEQGATRQGVPAITMMQQTMRFPLANGFPVITERSVETFWDRPIGELCAFINGITDLEGLKEFGCTWWGPWVRDELTELFDLPKNNIGPAGYGGAFHDFPTLDGGRFDQFGNLVRQIKELPGDRVHMVNPWMPAENARGKGFKQKNTIAPCHGWVHVRVINGRLHLHMYQRSGDTPVGVPSNMIQYAALLLMLEHLTGFEAAVYYHTISDAHIYGNQAENVKKLISREPLRLPTVRLNEAGLAVEDIHDFRREHFELTDYQAHEAMRDIPVST